MLRSSQFRSNWLGFAFLGLAGLLALATLFLVLTDRSLTDLSLLNGGSEQSHADGTGSDDVEIGVPTVAPTATPGPVLHPIPEDVELTAQSAFVVHEQTDTTLFARAADKPVQPASTAKIFTALAVLRHASPDEVIEIVEQDIVDPVAESSMGLQPGDRVTVHDLLVGLMLPSGNDAANALGRVIGERVEVDGDDLSPQERFVREMNAVADDLGLSESNLLHPAGHDREGQAVTARELAIAAGALLERPSMGPVVAMREAEIQVGGDEPRVITVENTNELLIHEEVFGVKTGTTDEAGECLVVALRSGDETVIAVILGSQDRYGDARALLGLSEPPEPEEEPEEGPPDEETDEAP